MSKSKIERYGPIISAVIIGCCSLGAAIIISGGVQRGVDRALEGNEGIAVEVQGFNQDNSTDRLAIAHNFSSKAGNLKPDVVIIVRDKDGKELTRLRKSLNPGVRRPDQPYRLLGNSGWTYYLGPRDRLPDDARHCVLQYEVWRSADETRTAQTPSFDCNNE